MSDVYQLSASGVPPVDIVSMKAALKLTTDADDSLILSWIKAAMSHGQNRTGREFTANTWILLKDAFETRICLDRSPVDSVTTVERMVSGSFETVADSVYYLKAGVQSSEILLDEDQEWPSDADDREQVVRITFVTAEYTQQGDLIRTAMMNHVSSMYANRGDCEGPGGEAGRMNAADTSGANALYDEMTIARF